ncbi:MAG: hypothetical protein HYX78_11780 [Armatimonadetes bacterium]|nr:hypothetical protein [Armatimonadota bacterium]
MKPKPIPGFSALKFKEEAQARVQAELDGLSPEEEVTKLNEMVLKGYFGEWWKRKRAEQRAEIRARLDREEKEDAA